MRIFSVQYACFYVSFQICEINGNEYESLEFRGGWIQDSMKAGY